MSIINYIYIYNSYILQNIKERCNMQKNTQNFNTKLCDKK